MVSQGPTGARPWLACVSVCYIYVPDTPGAPELPAELPADGLFCTVGAHECCQYWQHSDYPRPLVNATAISLCIIALHMLNKQPVAAFAALQVPSVLLAAGLAVGLLLTPVAADAKQQPASPAQTRGLKQQREVQEKMCGQEWKRLDQILMQQMKEREAQ